MNIHFKGDAKTEIIDSQGRTITYTPNCGPIWHKYVPAQGTFFLISSPTANCQIMSIAGMCILLRCENAEELLKEAIRAGKKNMLLIDVNQKYAPNITKLFQPSEIVVKSPYTNTRGTPMIIYVLLTSRYLT